MPFKNWDGAHYVIVHDVIVINSLCYSICPSPLPLVSFVYKKNRWCRLAGDRRRDPQMSSLFPLCYFLYFKRHLFSSNEFQLFLLDTKFKKESEERRLPSVAGYNLIFFLYVSLSRAKALFKADYN